MAIKDSTDQDYSLSQMEELITNFDTLEYTKYNTPKLIRSKHPLELFIL